MDQSKPLISVIVPVYNVAALVKRCLDSVAAQTYPRLEIIAVDDGSADGSGGICESCAALDERLEVVRLPVNRGASAARNEGLRRARGEYLTFVDADDYLEPDMLERMYRQFLESGADIAVCGIDGPSPAGEAAGVWSGREALGRMLRGDPFSSEVGGKLFRAGAVRDCPFCEDVFCYEDYLLLCRLLKDAGRVCYLPDRLYHYVRREGSLFTGGFSEKKCRSALTVHDRVCRAAAAELPELLPDFRKTALNGLCYLAVQAVSRGEACRGVLDSLGELQRGIRQHFDWRALARLPGKKAAAVLLLYLSRPAFLGAALLREAFRRLTGK